MITRRLCLALPALAVPVASCAGLAYRNATYLSDTLTYLEGIQTEAELIDRIGEPRLRAVFDAGDEDVSHFSRFSKAEWADSCVQTPANLIETLPRGTRMIGYVFVQGSPSNPLQGPLFVCIREDGRIIGWMYSKALAKFTGDAALDRSHQR